MANTTTTTNLGISIPSSGSPDYEGPVGVLAAAVAQLDTLFGLQTDTGTANTYAVTLSPAIALYAGMEINFKAVHANTGASTLALNGGSAKAITKSGTTALAGAEISANQIVKVIYDGTQWQLISQ